MTVLHKPTHTAYFIDGISMTRINADHTGIFRIVIGHSILELYIYEDFSLLKYGHSWKSSNILDHMLVYACMVTAMTQMLLLMRIKL